MGVRTLTNIPRFVKPRGIRWLAPRKAVVSSTIRVSRWHIPMNPDRLSARPSSRSPPCTAETTPPEPTISPKRENGHRARQRQRLHAPSPDLTHQQLRASTATPDQRRRPLHARCQPPPSIRPQLRRSTFRSKMNFTESSNVKHRPDGDGDSEYRTPAGVKYCCSHR